MLPIETIKAMFPSSEECGKITLLPMTLAHAAAMEAVGVDMTTAIDWDHILVAAWILSTTSADIRFIMGSGGFLTAFRKWCDDLNPKPEDLVDGVERIVASAFAAFVPPSSDATGGKMVWGENRARGFGWVLEIAELISHEYGIPFDEAADMPMCRAYALINCANKRNNGKFGGPDYYERIEQSGIMDQFKKMKHENQGKGN